MFFITFAFQKLKPYNNKIVTEAPDLYMSLTIIVL